MLTTEQIKTIEAEFEAGATLEQVAERRGISRQVLKYQILNSGKRIVLYRRLEDTAPLNEAQETGDLHEMAAA